MAPPISSSVRMESWSQIYGEGVLLIFLLLVRKESGGGKEGVFVITLKVSSEAESEVLMVKAGREREINKNQNR